MIRPATPDDLEAVMERLYAFHAYSPWRDAEVNDASTRVFVGNCIDGGGVFLSDTGVIGGLITPLFFNVDLLIATELFWWAPAGGGRQLREAFETWARERGAWRVQCSALWDEHLPKVSDNYFRNGYLAAEVSFLKGL